MTRGSWGDYEAAAKRGPWSITTKVLGFLVALSVVIAVVGGIAGWFGEAGELREDCPCAAALAEGRRAALGEALDAKLPDSEDRPQPHDPANGGFMGGWTAKEAAIRALIAKEGK